MGAAFKAALIEQAKAMGFDTVGVADARRDPSSERDLCAYLQQGCHGEMAWMEATKDRRSAIPALWRDARSAISLGVNYGPRHDPLAKLAHRDRGAISCYALNKDYHDLVKKRLKAVARWIVDRTGAEAKVFVDTAPIMEKPAAQRAGLGWLGKHTNLVSQSFGSWLLLGEILVDRAIDADEPHSDRCGTCRRCLEICPTKAFPNPYRMDARRCISYLTIEHKGPIPREFRDAIGNRIYGCDDCLAVCPWNKFAQASSEAAFLPRAELTAPRLSDFLGLDRPGFRSLFAGSPIKRIGRDRLLRNVLIALGNSGDRSMLQGVDVKLRDDSALVRGAAVWAFRKLASNEEFEASRAAALQAEQDPQVRSEWLIEAVSEEWSLNDWSGRNQVV